MQKMVDFIYLYPALALRLYPPDRSISVVMMWLLGVLFNAASLANALVASSRIHHLHGRRRTLAAASLPNTLHHHYHLQKTSSLNSCLRTLYAPIPKLNNEEGNSSDNNNNNTEIISSKWVDNITSGTLKTEDGSPHEIYYEVHHRLPFNNLTNETSSTIRQQQQQQQQQQRGLIGLFLHGGPGSGCYPKHTQFFSPELYEYVVLFDQRGCGRSVPLGEVQCNTLELLVNDVEMLRLHLVKERLIDGWVVSDDDDDDNSNGRNPWDVILGGSWGCTLAMAYAFTYPNSVRAMVLRGICLFRRREIDWLFGNPPNAAAQTIRPKTSNLRDLVAGGSSSTAIPSTTDAAIMTTKVQESSRSVVAAQLFPQQWKEFSSAIQQYTQNNNNRSVLHGYYQHLLGSDVNKSYQAMRSWFRWEMGIYASGLKKKSEDKHDENLLLVWQPASAAWKYEDARVRDQNSVDSICVDDDISNNSYEEILCSLRQFSTSSSQSDTSVGTDDEKMLLEPIPIEEAKSNLETEEGNGQGNSTATFIPAQAMLTCYYSVNDDYCIQPYNSFLSLNPPPSILPSSWYSSKLPPPPSSSGESYISSDSSFPLPPTIAIQGGNDAICPPDTALDLQSVWKQLELRIALRGGHSMYDPVIACEIVKSLDRFGHALAND